jgi:hypothetical protein
MMDPATMRLYADQNERDHAALERAVRYGRPGAALRGGGHHTSPDSSRYPYRSG